MADGHEERTLVEIIEDSSPIDPSKYMNFVSKPHCGAIATFAGTTRDSFEGKRVIELRYEAYVSMAIKQLRSICKSALSSWDLDSIAIAHKLGVVPVGQTSVFVAVSSVHRSDSLDACKYLIDEIKASVPIWKKEVYANGEIWKENSEFLVRRSDLGKKAGDKVVGGCCGKKVYMGCTNDRAHVKDENGELRGVED